MFQGFLFSPIEPVLFGYFLTLSLKRSKMFMFLSIILFPFVGILTPYFWIIEAEN